MKLNSVNFNTDIKFDCENILKIMFHYTNPDFSITMFAISWKIWNFGGFKTVCSVKKKLN